MLEFTRAIGETFRVGDDVTVTLLDLKGKLVRIGINAPREVAVHREETSQQIEEEIPQGKRE